MSADVTKSTLHGAHTAAETSAAWSKERTDAADELLFHGPDAPQEEPVACGCISDLSNMLRPHNTGLVTTMFNVPERVVIATDKMDVKKRGKPAILVATYCPFCGVKYAPSRLVFQPVAAPVSAGAPS